MLLYSKHIVLHKTIHPKLSDGVYLTAYVTVITGHLQTLLTGRKAHELRGGNPLCVGVGPASPHRHYRTLPLLCGQCHYKLSISSVTVAGGPSGTTGGGRVDAGLNPLLHHTQQDSVSLL